MTDSAARRAARFFETLAPADLDRLAGFYAPDARFRDPFNDVQGLDAVRAVFAHMFDTLDAPRFVIRDLVESGEDAFLTWDMHFRRRGAGGSWHVHGGTHLRFAPDGRILLHRDYWDAAGELYEKLPVLGALLRWLRRRLATPLHRYPALPPGSGRR